eukprot:scaffold2191_cov92-Skeletonema_marinoi.AAC.14
MLSTLSAVHPIPRGALDWIVVLDCTGSWSSSSTAFESEYASHYNFVDDLMRNNLGWPPALI